MVTFQRSRMYCFHCGSDSFTCWCIEGIESNASEVPKKKLFKSGMYRSYHGPDCAVSCRCKIFKEPDDCEPTDYVCSPKRSVYDITRTQTLLRHSKRFRRHSKRYTQKAKSSRPKNYQRGHSDETWEIRNALMDRAEVAEYVSAAKDVLAWDDFIELHYDISHNTWKELYGLYDVALQWLLETVISRFPSHDHAELLKVVTSMLNADLLVELQQNLDEYLRKVDISSSIKWCLLTPCV